MQSLTRAMGNILCGMFFSIAEPYRAPFFPFIVIAVCYALAGTCISLVPRAIFNHLEHGQRSREQSDADAIEQQELPENADIADNDEVQRASKEGHFDENDVADREYASNELLRAENGRLSRRSSSSYEDMLPLVSGK